MMLAALCKMAVANTSRGWTSVALRIPFDTSSRLNGSPRELRQKTKKCSCLARLTDVRRAYTWRGVSRPLAPAIRPPLLLSAWAGRLAVVVAFKHLSADCFLDHLFGLDNCFFG